MPMTVRIGQHEFDDVSYDANGDVLYLSAGAPGRRGRGRWDARGSLGAFR
jgi:hypothetical protein